MSEPTEYQPGQPLDFTPPPPSRGGRGRRTQSFVEALKERPGEWAFYGAMKTDSPGAQYGRQNPGTEWTSRKIDGLTHLWGRWVGDSDA